MGPIVFFISNRCHLPGILANERENESMWCEFYGNIMFNEKLSMFCENAWYEIKILRISINNYKVECEEWKSSKLSRKFLVLYATIKDTNKLFE